jgi:hypothetical protein
MRRPVISSMDSGPVDELHSFVKIGDLALGARFLKGWRRRNRWTTWAHSLNINHYRLYSVIARDTSFTADVPEAEWREG